jgi:hypothetical protein
MEGISDYIVACRAVSMQRLCKHVPAATDTHEKIEILLETVFSTQSVQRGYKEYNWSKNSQKYRRLKLGGGFSISVSEKFCLSACQSSEHYVIIIVIITFDISWNWSKVKVKSLSLTN